MSLERFKNIEQVKGRTPVFGKTLDPEPTSVEVPLTDDDINGNFTGVTVAPNLEYHVYAEDNLIKSQVGLNIQSTTTGNSIGSQAEVIQITPEKDLRDAGVVQGAYSIVYNFLHTLDEAKIIGISSDRTELLLQPIIPFDPDLAPSDGAPAGVQVVQTPNGPVSMLPSSPAPEGAALGTFDNFRNFYTSNSLYIKDVVLNFGDNNLKDVANVEFDGDPIGIQTLQRDYPTVFEGVPTIFVPVDNRLQNLPLGNWIPLIEIYNPAINQNQDLFGVVTGRSRRFKLKRAADVPQNAGFVNRVIWEAGVNIFTSYQYPDDLNYHPTRNTKHNFQDLFFSFDFFNTEIDIYNRLIVKLTEPLSEDISTGQQLTIDNRIKKSWVEKIIAFPSNLDVDRPSFSEPDFNMNLDTLQGADGTEFETYNSLLDVDATTSQQLINKYFSGSLGNVKLNIDYSDFANYVHFSSATERVDNFKYKLEQIEKFDARINLLQNISASDAYTNISQSMVRRDRIIGGFDDFEKYLYYDTDTNNYTHWSSSANTIDPFPKVSTFPHVLYHTTSSQGENWYSGVYDSASLYDSFNDSRLRNMIPIHLQEDERNEEYITFVDMIGQHFDIQWSYIQSLTTVNSREEHPKDGMPDDVLKSVAESFGWKLSNGYSDVNLWNYALGVESDGTLYQSGSLKSKPREQIVHETWRRIVNSIPMLYKTKGTARSIKALLSTYGIPQAFLQIREWGGPTISTRRNIFERERFVNKLEVTDTDFFSNPWGEVGGINPHCIEIIEKLPQADHNIMVLRPDADGALLNPYNLIWDYDGEEKKGKLVLKQRNTFTVASSSLVPYVTRKDCVIMIQSASNDKFEFGISFVDDFGEILASDIVSIESGSTSFTNLTNSWNATEVYTSEVVVYRPQQRLLQVSKS